MDEGYDQQQPEQQWYGKHYQGGRYENRAHQLVKAATAVTAGGSLLVISGLILAGTVIALTVATPLLIIFSPVLVPAVITVGLLGFGFLVAGGFSVAAIAILSWIYRYITGGNPPGSEKLDSARNRVAGKAREMKERAEQYGGHQYGGAQQHGAHQVS